MKRLQDYINENTGKGINWDGQYGNQCMDLYRHYVNWLGVPKQSMPVAGAADIWTTYLTEYFDQIINTLTFVPSAGDIVIWKRSTSLKWGHVAIFVTGDTSKFISFDQNWPQEGYTDSKGNFIGTGTPHLQEHNYINVIGVLRLKKEETMPINDEFGDTVYKSSQYDEVVHGVFGEERNPRATPAGELLATINGYKAQATDMRNKLAAAEAEVANRIEQVSRLKGEAAEKESLYLDVQTALKQVNDKVVQLTGSYTARIEGMEDEIAKMGKEKGELAIALSQREAEVAELKKGNTSSLTLHDVMLMIIPKFIKLLQSIKLTK